MITVYIGTPLQGIPTVFFLDRALNGRKEIERNLWNMFQGASGEAPFDFLHIVSNPEEADFLLIPHNYFSIWKKDSDDEYIKGFVSLAEKYKKKILIFVFADSDEHIDVPHSFIFRYSQYGYKKRENEIMIPPYLPHFRNAQLAEYRKKVWENISFCKKNEKSFDAASLGFARDRQDRPTVSFCGWADFPSTYRRVTYGLRIFLAYIKKYIFRNKHAILHLHGVYFRRKSINALKNSRLVTTHFLLRKSFSAQKGIDGEKEIIGEFAEKEYVENILNSDFVLAPKGHANESVRFYEALSLGRFPVLINTDKVLPLQDYIDYDKFVVKIDYTKLKHMEQKIVAFYNSLNNEELEIRQKMAREAFELLRPGSFLQIVLSELKKKESGSI
ncbi:MAG: exostosin family protein [Parcubacteria group bacterium]|nr:exostosin family protein [Parcubacteria group bacterium]